jgi:5'-3' exonuclease
MKPNLDETTKLNIFNIVNNYSTTIILDASQHLYRFAYAHRMLSINHMGKEIPTGHIYGFLKMLVYLKRKFVNPAIIIAIDGYDRERELENSDYKSNRPEKDVSVHKNTDDIIKLSAMLSGVFVSYNSKYEADDTIYNISRTLDTLQKKNNIDKNIYIYAMDKDLMQCVNDKILMIRKFGTGKDWMKKADIVNETIVRETFSGVRPDRIAMFRSIAGGDTSDNIKGYPRFPSKIASIIAEECIVTDTCIVPPDNDFLERNPKIQKHLDIINNDFSKFKSNYAIMKMKEYDFTIRIPDRDNAVYLIDYYKLNSYKKELALIEGIILEEDDLV